MDKNKLTDEAWASALAEKIGGKTDSLIEFLRDGLTREEAEVEERRRQGLPYDSGVYKKRAVMRYTHEWDDGFMDGECKVRTCRLCGVTLALLRLRDLKLGQVDNKLAATCPEKIVREVVRRLEKKEESL